MAEQLLDDAEIGAVLQQMAGKSVAQDVRADLFGGETGGNGQIFQIAGEGLAGEVAGFAVRWKEPAAFGGFRIPEREERGNGLPRFAGEGNEALAAAFAFDREEIFRDTPGACRQGHKLGDAQACSVEQFEKCEKAGRAEGPARCICGVDYLAFGFGEQGGDRVDGEDFGQGTSALRGGDQGGRIVWTAVFGVEKTEILAQGGGFALGGAGFYAGFGEMIEVEPQGIGGGGIERRGRVEKIRGILKIAAIGVERVFGCTAFGGQHCEEGRYRVGWRRGLVHLVLLRDRNGSSMIRMMIRRKDCNDRDSCARCSSNRFQQGCSRVFSWARVRCRMSRRVTRRD